MTRLRASHVAELAAELRPLVLGWTLREVQPLPPRDLLLILEPPEPIPDGPPILRVRLSAHPDGPRLHLQQGRVNVHKGSAAPFFLKAHEELLDSKLHAIDPLRSDRLARLEFRDTPSGRPRALVLELIGRHGNLVLTDQDDVVLDLLIPGVSRKGAAPRLEVGKPWQPPGSGSGAPTDDGPSIAAAFPQPDDVPPGPVKDRAPLSWAVEIALGSITDAAQDEDDRRRLLQRAKRKLSRALGNRKGLAAREDSVAGSERIRQDGELLKAALGRFQRGAKSIELDDWFEPDAPKRTIELDPKLKPNDNVERVFARYRKLERSRAGLGEEIARADQRIADLEALLSEAADCEDPEALDASAVKRGLLDHKQEADLRKRKAPVQRLPYKTFQACDGTEILVGRTAKDNDTLTMRIARGNDLWLHTADCPGSHVVMRLQRNQEPHPDAVLDAAFLAIHFSPIRDAGRGPVHVVRRKHINKPKGAKPGLVHVTAGKVLQVRVEPKRLASLLRTDRKPDEG